MGSRLDATSNAVRKRIESHDFQDEAGEEYEASSFGGFGDYMRRKKVKLQNLDAEIRATSGDCSPIFRGVVAHVNGYTQPSLQDLHRLIVSHGGGFLQYLDSKTIATHIIASSLTPKKREEFRRYRIVKPAWVTESIKAGRLLPWDEFRVVDEGQAQKVLKFDDGRFTSQTNTPQSGYRDQSKTSWYNSQLQAMSTTDRSPINLNQDPSTPSKLPPQAAQVPSQPTQSDYGDFPSFSVLEGERTLGICNDLQGEMYASIDPEIASVDTQSKDPLPNASGSPMNNTHISQAPKQMTSEEYNAQLLSDPRMRKSSVVNPEFLQQYYRESRLHHLSTWKAELKAQLQAATREKALLRASIKPAPGARRYILHVDFDSFFAAVSILKHPELREKPVAIAHGSGSGSEIASCNYVARGRGVKNGMWMKGALQACPELQVLPYDFPAYEDASRKFYNSVLSIDGVAQSVSIDEALIDVTTLCLEAGGSDGKAVSEGSIYREQLKADEIAQDLRDQIKERTGCAVSVGIGGNILMAKVALRKAKPAGQFQLKPDDVLDFIGNLTVQDLPGVGYSLGSKLEELGVKYVKDARDLTKERLTSTLGPKTGTRIWEYARGIDKTEVGNEVMRKSVSAEVNWGIRFVNQDQADDFVRSLCEELSRRLVENLVKGKQLTLKVMRRSMDAPLEPVKHLGHGKCDVFNKSVVIGVTTNTADILAKEAVSMLKSLNFSPGDLRGLGVQMTKLEPLKPGPSSSLESSQRQLNFQKSPSRKPVNTDPDELESPRKGYSARIQVDPVLSNSAHKPLNISGSQFIMPTQADPKVVSELPGDIRSRLVAQAKDRRDSHSRSPCPPSRRSLGPSVTDLPPQSQLDPETLAALPDDVRNEVLGYYCQPPGAAAQSAAPALSWPGPAPGGSLGLRRPASPPKKRRGRPPKSATSSNKALAQSTFGFSRPPALPDPAMAVRNQIPGPQQQSPAVEEPGVSAEFLAALPEDIRREVLEDQERARLQRARTAPSTAARPISQPQAPAPAPIPVERTLHLSPLPERPVFTSRRLSSLPDLRDAVSAWHAAFATDGPYSEDAEVLCTYLFRVVADERDIDKAVSVVRWLIWLVDEDSLQRGPGGNKSPPSGQGGQGIVAWIDAIDSMKRRIQGALEKRGLPPVDFD
ncbi:DNA repair protein Rev1 [Penicillium macrosclerotiorum]|uniref:DNA repair protein Rev1 n=1 Tax=Penicillium macrosclerotiorum TaxID=303699 RepID=UPI002547D3CC|nr:DNA repair protein Rev1 [Penicillium macrosclerotiorum]KAJ5669478.1 DNA repair protein Rev1 [Penicillium macrosclerotiorum]